MNTEMKTARLLGTAFLFVAVASLLGEVLLSSVIGSGTISEILVNIPENLTLMRVSILLTLLTVIGIVVLATLLYLFFNTEYKIVALVGLGWWLAEAVTLVVSKIGTYGLIPLSQEFVAAGAPESSHYQTLGDFLYYAFDRQGNDIHMLFFCLGGILWYYLFYRSRTIPRILSIWGLAAIGLVSINALLVLYDRDLGWRTVMLAPYIPYEFVLGIWLMFKGFKATRQRI